MSQEEQGALLLNLIKEDKEVQRRLACRMSLARKAATACTSLTQPWGLDFDYIRKEMGLGKDITLGEFVDQVERDVKETSRLKKEIEAITNP